MHIYKVLFLMILPLSPALQLKGAAAGDQTVNTQILSCNGTNVTCNYALNAVGQQHKIDIHKATLPDKIGKISSPTSRNLILPHLNKQKLLTLTITKSFSEKYIDQALVNIPMEVLFVGSAPDTEGFKQMSDAVSMLKVYRRMQGETLWNERGTILFGTTLDQIRPVPLTIHPNGVASFMKPDGELATINLGEA